jgi:hypothetical protein
MAFKSWNFLESKSAFGDARRRSDRKILGVIGITRTGRVG